MLPVAFVRPAMPYNNIKEVIVGPEWLNSNLRNIAAKDCGDGQRQELLK